MDHHVVGYGPAENAAIAIKWILIWLFACGIPLVISLAMPPWVKVEGQQEDHH